MWEKRSNEHVQQVYGKGSIVQFVKGVRLEWAGHVSRADNSIVRTVLVNNMNRIRPRGRPKQRWLDVVKRDLQELKPNNSKILGQLSYWYVYVSWPSSWT